MKKFKLTLLVLCVFSFFPRVKAEDTFMVPMCNQGFTLSHNGVQGMDTWGDTLVSLQNYGTCNIYKLNSLNAATKITTFKLASYNNVSATYNHANVAAFSNQFYKEGDELPLLYVTRCHSYTDEDGMNSVCFVERLDVKNSTSTLVQKISYSGMSYHVVLWTIDRQENCLYAVSNTVGAGKVGNQHYVRKFKIPEVGEGKPDKVYLTDADAIESYNFEDTYSGGMNAVTQGGAIHNGLLYMPCGYDTSDEPSILYVWNLKNRTMEKELNMTGIFKGEFEDCSVNYNGLLTLQCNTNHIYFMDLENQAGDWKDLILYDGVAYRITDREQKTCQLVSTVKVGEQVSIPTYVADGNVYYKVTSIAPNAFQNNTTLTGIVLPEGLTSIGAGAFSGCTALKDITSKIINPAQCSITNAFESVTLSTAVLTVPTGKRIVYRCTNYWKKFTSMQQNSVVLNVGFTSNGITLKTGESTNVVGMMGEAIVQPSLDGSYYVGSSKVQTTSGNTASCNGNSAFYVKYDASDKVGQTLKDQFTVEALFRMDKIASVSQSSSVWNPSGTSKILGSQGGGGFSLMQNYTTNRTDASGNRVLRGLATEYIYNHLYASDVYGVYNHVYSDCYLNPGRFYHVAIAIDKGAHKESIYVNGKLQMTADLAGVGDFVYPAGGTTSRSKGLYFILGGDAASETTPTKVDNPNATTFVYFKIHNRALDESQVAELYNTDEVKKFTEPVVEERLLDVQFGKDGTFRDASAYTTIVKPDEAVINTAENADVKRYEMVCEGNVKNFLYRPYYYDPAFTRGICDGYSIEAYAKVSDNYYSAFMSPISSQQNGGGPGLEINTSEQITFNANACGFSGPTKYTYTNHAANFSVGNMFTTDDYIHYVVVFASNPDMKKEHGVASIYINGKLANSCTLNGNEVTELPFAGWQWFCVGGDANPNSDYSNCGYPWQGNISIARVWGKPLSEQEVGELYKEATHPGESVTLSANGYAAVCYPFNMKVPAGVSAYVVTSESDTTVTLASLANAGDVVPYGLPVILRGAAGATYALEAVLPDNAVEMPANNLLRGNFTSYAVENGQTYTIEADDTDDQVCQHAAGSLLPYQAFLPNVSGTSIQQKRLVLPFVLGDLNGDNVINVGDVTILVDMIMKNYTTKDDTFKAADINGDGILNVGDITSLVNMIMEQ